MKTVPYLYAEGQGEIKLSSIEAVTNGELTKEMNGHKPEFMDIFNQNSLFRFMKIHTGLMEETGVNRNDIAVIDTEEIPVTGKIVVVKVDDTLMIRRYEKMKNGFLLQADAQKIAPLKIESGCTNVTILGVVNYIIKSL